jgi:hypothetical protein
MAPATIKTFFLAGVETGTGQKLCGGLQARAGGVWVSTVPAPTGLVA